MQSKNLVTPIFYATDSKKFYDSKLGSEVTDSQIEVLLLLNGIPKEDIDKAKLEIAMAGKPYNEHRAKRTLDGKMKLTPKHDLKLRLDGAYADLTLIIPILFLHKTDGTHFAFKKISKNEVCTIKNVESRSLATAILSDEVIEPQFRIYYEDSIVIRSNILYSEFLEQMVERAKVDVEKRIYKDPKIITWDENEIAFKYFNPDVLTDGATPYFDDFCNRLGPIGSDLFKAWCWSIFEPGNNCRQMMWIQGAGQDGKSTVFNCLSAFIGDQHCASLSESEFNNSFFFNDIYGRILAIYGDCHTTNIFENEKLKNITGNDMVTINGKYAPTFKANVYSKVLIGSNQFPQVAWHMDYQSSRIIVLQITKPKGRMGDSSVQAKMIKETPAFLKKCREIYPKYFPTHSDLDVPEEYQKFMHDTYISNEMAVIREFCAEHIELGESFSVPRLQVSSLLKNEFRNKSVRVPKDVDDMFQKYVRHLSKYIQGPVLVPKGNGDTIGFKGFRLKDPPNEFTKGKK